MEQIRIYGNKQDCWNCGDEIPKGGVAYEDEDENLFCETCHEDINEF